MIATCITLVIIAAVLFGPSALSPQSIWRRLARASEITMTTFQIGDRVKVSNLTANVALRGKKGRVVAPLLNDRIGVEMDDEFFFGHSCDGPAKSGHGWYMCHSEITLIPAVPFEAGGNYCVGDGSRARVYAVDGRDPYVIHGATETREGWAGCVWRADGTPPGGGVELALMPPAPPAPERARKTRWINIDADGTSTLRRSREMADDTRFPDRIACVAVTFDIPHGYGLDKDMPPIVVSDRAQIDADAATPLRSAKRERG